MRLRCFLIFILLLPLSHFGQQGTSKNSAVDITGLELRFNGFLENIANGFQISGDFKIIHKNNQFIAMSSHDLFCGSKKVEKWESELSKKEISAVKRFIRGLENSDQNVGMVSFSNDFYTATYKGKSWEIRPGQSIFKSNKNKSENTTIIPYLKFYKTIFKEQLSDFEIARKANESAVNKCIMRRWYLDSTELENLKRGSKIHLHSSPNSAESIFWEIHDDNSFSRSNQAVTDTTAKVLIEYNASESSGGHLYLTIYAYNLVMVNDKELWEYRYTSFYILSLSATEMVLQIA